MTAVKKSYFLVSKSICSLLAFEIACQTLLRERHGTLENARNFRQLKELFIGSQTKQIRDGNPSLITSVSDDP